MPLNNCNITIEELSGAEGTVSGGGITNLTITPELGYTVINNDGSLNAYIGGATEVNPNEWVGGNVTAGVTKVIFSNNGNNTLNVAVHYAAIDWNFATDLYVDIDGKANQIIIDGDPVNDIDQGDTTNDTTGDLPDNGNNNEILCRGFTFVLVSVLNANTDMSDGAIQATGNGGSSDYTYEVVDTVTGLPQNPFALPAGVYDVTVVDNNLLCEETQQVTVMQALSTSYTVNTFDIGGRGFGNELLPTASSQLITIQHGDLAEFDLEVVDPGNGGGWYDFEKHTFTSARYVCEVEAGGSSVTRKTINFPAVSSTAIYSVFLTPKGGTSFLEGVPTKNNPEQIYQRVNNIITVTFTSENSEWGSFGNFTIEGRPNKKPIHSYNGAFTNKEFSITATLTLGGKTATAIAGVNKAALSLPQQSGTIVSYRNKENYLRNKKDNSTGFISNKFSFNNFKSVLSGTTLTVTGKFNVEQFGSLGETITINIDKLFTVA